jgi:uncharacterized damage-inducible protein DinB
MKETILRLARYNQWANQKIVDLLKMHGAQYIEMEIVSSFSSISKTIYHIANAEYIWLCRLEHVTHETLPGTAGKDIDCLCETDNELLRYIESKGEPYFEQSTTYKTLKGDEFTNKNSAIFTHLFNHATFHRGQIVSMLRNAGYTGDIDQTDYIAFERM